MFLRIFLPILLFAAGLGAWNWLGKPVDTPKFEEQVRQRIKTERLVLSRTNFPVFLESQGAISPHHATTVTALVPGTIITIHPTFEDGAFFRKGDVLLELDPGDLQAALSSAESRLARAEAALAQEEAKAKQARLNWDDIGYKEEPSPLVLRVPQLKDVHAQVTSARTDVEQATRNLNRAQIRAPFDGRVKNRLVGLGQAVTATTPLGDIFSTDLAEIRLPLSADQISFVVLPKRESDPPVPVTITDALGKRSESNATTWEAQIIRTEGALDESSRELFVIARIHDPFGLQSGKPELKIGQPVRASIQGITLPDVFVIPRTALRGVNRIYLIDPENLTLSRKTLNPIWSTSDSFIVQDEIRQGDWLATSRLNYAPNGAPVEIIESSIASEPDSASTKSGS
jgi:RND family efflux transporter MFP subunit